MGEKRTYNRISVEIPGTLYKGKYEIPIQIVNISENGIGFRYKYRDCPADFIINTGNEVNISFFDKHGSFSNEPAIQLCMFKTVHLRRHSSHAYIGGRLIKSESNYPQYVLDKKSQRFIYTIRGIQFC